MIENSQSTLKELFLYPIINSPYGDEVHEFMKEVLAYEYSELTALILYNNDFCSLE